MQREILSRAIWGMSALALVAGAASTYANQPTPAGQTFEFHRPDVLGTSLDLSVTALTRAEAELAEQAVLREVERLRKILSAYDPQAELARVNRSTVNGEGVAVSRELLDVLKQYERWTAASKGAYSAQVGALLAKWKSAEQDNQLPADAALLALAKELQSPGWEIDEARSTMRRLADRPINVDSLGKGFIVQKAVEAATRDIPQLKGLLLNIGGDIRIWGWPGGAIGTPWKIAIQDPTKPELNAKPIASLNLPGHRAIATSGGYHRFYTIGGKRYSHIVDARTGQSAANASATVIADDSATANALATILCLLRPGEGLALVKTVPGADCIIVTHDGRQARSKGFKDYEDVEWMNQQLAIKSPSQFPAGFKLSIALETVKMHHGPYIAVWIADDKGKHVKTLGQWGDDSQYQPDLPEWWKIAKGNRLLTRTSHATQGPGKYPLAWDGTDQQGNGVPLGKYRVWVEVCEEHGPYSAKSVAIELGKEPAQATINKSKAFNDVTITFGQGGK